MKERLIEASRATGNKRLQELNRIRGERLAKAYGEAREEARKDLQKLKYNPLFIAGVMLYWGEGTKTPSSNGLKFSNTDPEMVRLYVSFLRKVCRIPIEKIKLHVLIYPDLDDLSCRRFWSAASELPLSQFTKSVRVQGRHRTNRLSWGVCLVTVSSTYLKEKMLEWLKLLPGELMNKEYYENI